MRSSMIKPRTSIPRLILSDPGDMFFNLNDNLEDVVIYDRHTFDEIVRVYMQGPRGATRLLANRLLTTSTG